MTRGRIHACEVKAESRLVIGIPRWAPSANRLTTNPGAGRAWRIALLKDPSVVALSILPTLAAIACSNGTVVCRTHRS